MRRAMSLAFVAAAALLAAAASGEEVRWINPEGGEWNDPTNWDPPHVPECADDVVFDLDATYTVTVCGPKPEPFWSLRIDNSKITFDLCGGSFISWRDGTDRTCGPDSPEYRARVDIGRDAVVPTEVTFENGNFADPNTTIDVLFFNMYVGAEGMPRTRFTIAETASWGRLNASFVVQFRGEGELNSHGTMELRDCSVSVGDDIETVVTSDVELANGRLGSGKMMDLRAHVQETVEYSTLSGSVLFRDGSLARVSNLNLNHAIFQGSAFASGGYGFVRGVYDFREIDGSGIRLGGYPGRNLEIEVVYGPCNFENVAGIHRSYYNFYDDPYSWINSTFRFESDEPVGVGSVGMVGLWRSKLFFYEPTTLDIDMVVNAPGPGAGVMRWGPIEPQPDSNTPRVGVFVMGVPENWCPADLDLNGRLDFFDVAKFIGYYNEQSPWANINNDLRVNEQDVTDFIGVFTAGCP